MSLTVLFAILLLFCLLSLMAFAMGLIAWIEVKAMQKSTHSIQYVPAGTDFEKVGKELEEKITKDMFEAV